ncbi:MAG: serine/threonine protein kinase [Myxococcales bacterium]|nr:serine/threonine protein kinase [Myxococcales bacterium]
MAVESPHRPGTDHSGPTRLGRWDVVAKIASGGMSSIYLGRQVEPGPDPHEPRMVALKVLRHEVRDDPRVIKMFLTEGQLLVRLVHPNIVRTLEVHVDDERGFIAMELLLGQSIAAIQDACVERGLRLNPEIAAFCVARVADALQYANEITDDDGRPLDIIHRDVTPQNVFVSYAGEVKLIDFGMAKIVDGSITGPNLLVGKLPYLAPEQIQQMPLDHRTDIFALGVTFWELLTAKRLFRRNTDEETIEAVRSGRRRRCPRRSRASSRRRSNAIGTSATGQRRSSPTTSTRSSCQTFKPAWASACPRSCTRSTPTNTPNSKAGSCRRREARTPCRCRPRRPRLPRPDPGFRRCRRPPRASQNRCRFGATRCLR